MNTIIISGNTTRHIEIVEKGKITIGKFTVAVQRTYKNPKGEYDSDFLNCVIFNPTEYVKNNLFKGSKVLVNGSLQTSSFDDKNGNKHYSTDIIVNKVEILTPNKKTDEKPQEPPKNPFEEFGQQFEVGHNIEIDPDESLPF
jgi:single-strand DNA-binding protein